MSKPAIEVIVEPHSDNNALYAVWWCDHSDRLLHGLPECWLDVLPWLIARRLLEWEYDTERTLVVKLIGADYEMARAALGALAATPLLNTAAPVRHGTRAWGHPSP
jgi:hypothetical protein